MTVPFRINGKAFIVLASYTLLKFTSSFFKQYRHSCRHWANISKLNHVCYLFCIVGSIRFLDLCYLLPSTLWLQPLYSSSQAQHGWKLLSYFPSAAWALRAQLIFIFPRSTFLELSPKGNCSYSKTFQWIDSHPKMMFQRKSPVIQRLGVSTVCLLANVWQSSHILLPHRLSQKINMSCPWFLLRDMGGWPWSGQKTPEEEWL